MSHAELMMDGLFCHVTCVLGDLKRRTPRQLQVKQNPFIGCTEEMCSGRRGKPRSKANLNLVTNS